MHKLIQYLKNSLKINNYEKLAIFMENNMDEIKKTCTDSDKIEIYEYLKGIEIPEKIYDLIKSIDPTNHIVYLHNLREYYRKNDGLNFMEYIKDKPFMLKNEELKKYFYDLIITMNSFSKIYYSSCVNVYNEEDVNLYISNFYHFDDMKKVIDNYLQFGNYASAEKILTKCIEIKNDLNCYYNLIDIYETTGEKDLMEKMVNRIIQMNREKPNKKIADYLYFLGKYKQSIEYMDITDNTNARLGYAYYYSGNYENALVIFKNIYYNIDKNVLDTIIDIEYKIGDYGAVVSYINSHENHNDKKLLLYKIEAEIKLYMFIETEYDIKKYTKLYGSDYQLLNLELLYCRENNDEDREYRIAEEIMALGTLNETSIDIMVKYLYKNEKYSELNQFITSNNVYDRYRAQYAACLIFTNNFESAFNILSEDKSLLNSKYIVDSIFEKARDDKSLSIFEKLDYKNSLLEVIILYMRGMEPDNAGMHIKDIIKTGSIACAYILSMNGYNFINNRHEDYVDEILERENFETVRMIIKNVKNVYKNKIKSDMEDSIFFLYPLSNALINIGLYDDAEKNLTELFGKNPDPFFYYLLANIYFYKNDYSESKKYIIDALDGLTNARFLSLKIILNLIGGENLKDVFNTVVEYKLFSAFKYAYNTILEMKYSLPEGSVSHINGMKINDINFYRIGRHINSEPVEKLKYSACIMKFNNITVDDIVQHYYLLSRKNENSGIKFLEHLKVKNDVIYSLIGDYYFNKKYYVESAINYVNSYLRSEKKDISENFAKILSDKNILTSVIENSGKNNFYAIVLLYLKGNYSSIESYVNEINLDNRKGFEFIVNNLWSKSSIRSRIMELFIQTRNSILGEIICSKLDNDEDYNMEKYILQILHNSNPNNIKIILKLTETLNKNQEKEDAMEFLKSSFINLKERILFDRLLELYYNSKNYDAIITIYKKYLKFIDQNNIKYIFYSLIKLFRYQDVAILENEFMNSVDATLKEDIKYKLRTAFKFKNVLIHAKKLFKTEFEKNRLLSPDEATDIIPEYFIDYVFNFIRSGEPYTFIDKYAYNYMSVDILKKLFSMGYTELNQIRINQIFNVLGDVIKSKNFYLFINMAIDNVVNIGANKNYKNILKFINKKMNNPIEIVCNFNIGLIDAINIINIKEGEN